MRSTYLKKCCTLTPSKYAQQSVPYEQRDNALDGWDVKRQCALTGRSSPVKRDERSSWTNGVRLKLTRPICGIIGLYLRPPTRRYPVKGTMSRAVGQLGNTSMAFQRNLEEK
jgi:hypothetical protein